MDSLAKVQLVAWVYSLQICLLACLLGVRFIKEMKMPFGYRMRLHIPLSSIDGC